MNSLENIENAERTRSGVEHAIRMLTSDSNHLYFPYRTTLRLTREHNSEVDDMSDSERRVFAVILRVLYLHDPHSLTSVYMAHSYPGVWGLKNAFHLSQKIHSSVVPFVCPQSVHMDNTIKLLGGEERLEKLIDRSEPKEGVAEWWADPFEEPVFDQPGVGIGTPSSSLPPVTPEQPISSLFPSPMEVCNAYGDSILHTVEKDLEHYLRLWTELQVVLSNLRAKSAFLKHQELWMTSCSITRNLNGDAVPPSTVMLNDWVKHASSVTHVLPVPICLHVSPTFVHVRQELRTSGQTTPTAYPGMLRESARGRKGQPSLWHLTSAGRESLAVVGCSIDFRPHGGKVCCEGCRDRV